MINSKLTWWLTFNNAVHPFMHIFIIFYRLKDVQTLEELGDVYNHFLLYYGRDIPKMQNAAKANKKRLKKIKEVSEDGKMDVSEFTISSDDDGRILQKCPELNETTLELGLFALL